MSRDVERRSVPIEPLSLTIDEIDGGNRAVAELPRHVGDAIENVFGRRIENFAFVELSKPRIFAMVRRCNHGVDEANLDRLSRSMSLLSTSRKLGSAAGPIRQHKLRQTGDQHVEENRSSECRACLERVIRRDQPAGPPTSSTVA
jgi:hypothetical protein